MRRIIGIVLADRSPFMLAGLRAVLCAAGDTEITGEAFTAPEVVDLARRRAPDVVVIDQDLPGGALWATGAIKSDAPRTEVVIMARCLNSTHALRAIEGGATGYVSKSVPAANFVSALRALVRASALPLDPGDMRRLRTILQRCWPDAAPVPQADLTARELEILAELANGSTDREIARTLSLAEGTVKTHLRNILAKLGARNRTQAVAQVIRSQSTGEPRASTRTTEPAGETILVSDPF